jgi:hypothetical protein
VYSQVSRLAVTIPSRYPQPCPPAVHSFTGVFAQAIHRPVHSGVCPWLARRAKLSALSVTPRSAARAVIVYGQTISDWGFR